MSESGAFEERVQSTGGGQDHGLWSSDGGHAQRNDSGLAPETYSLLRQSFGPGVDEVAVEKNQGAKNRSIAAKAHTIGNKISLGDDIRDDPRDAHSMEVIAHEFAHALAKGGSGQHILDRPGDPGERDAASAVPIVSYPVGTD